MSKFLISLVFFLSLLAPAAAFSGQASAVNIFPGGVCKPGEAGSGSTACKSVEKQQGQNDKNPIITIIRAAINVLSFLVGILAVIGLIVSGIRLMTSGGDTSAVASARSGVIYSLIGILVVVLAQTIVVFALGR